METNETKQVVQRLTNLNDNGGKKTRQELLHQNVTAPSELT